MANNTDWLNISQMTGGTGETALSLTALTNSSLQPKTATITARNSQYNVSDTTTVTIQGFQPTLTLSRSTLRFDSTGGTATFTVYSNTAWTINFPALVHSYSTSAGTGDTEVTVVLAPNPDEVAKVDTGTVQDIFGINQLYLTIVQDSFITELTVTPDDDIIFANTGSSTSITIDTNTDWEIVYPAWVIPSVTSGSSGTTTVTFTAGQNGPTDRSGEITVYAGSKSVTINVFQPFYIAPYITVTPSAWTFNYTEDGKTFIVDSYPEWTGEIISTGETVWEDAYMEAVFDIPSAMTMPFYNGNSGGTTGIYLGPIKSVESAVSFESGGTYRIRYDIYSGGSTPILSGNQYLKEISLKDVNIQAKSFSGCSALSSVTLEGNIQSIKASGFAGCTSLSSITIPSTVTGIGDYSFSDCTNLSNITCLGAVAPSTSSNTFKGVPVGGTLTYPEGSDYSFWLSTTPYNLGFYGWNNIPRREISATIMVTTTSDYTKLRGNSSDFILETIIDDSIRLVGETSWRYTFSTTGLHTVKYIYTGTSLIYGCFSGTNLVNATIPDDITTFEQLCFSNCTSLSSVTIPNRLTSIGSGCFQKCTSLTAVTIPESVTEIGTSCFSGCTSLSSITIPESVTTIGNYSYPAFKNCTSLTSVTINSNAVLNSAATSDYRSSVGGMFGQQVTRCILGTGITIIGNYCFRNCTNLSNITCYAVTAPSFVGNYQFSGVPTGGLLKYPSGSDYSTWLSKLPSGWTGQEI